MTDPQRLNPAQANGQITTSVASAAKALEVSKGTIRKAIREGKLPSVLLGRRRLIFVEDLLIWVKGEQ